MKFRFGFISNSSSSSFIISYKEKAKIKIEIDLENLDNSMILKTKKDVDEYFLNTYWMEYSSIKEFLERADDKELIKRYKKTISELKKGNKILVCEVSNEDGTQEGAILMRGLPKTKGITIIIQNSEF
jgi:hypothetical protein